MAGNPLPSRRVWAYDVAVMTPNRREFLSTAAAAVVAPSPSPDRIDLAEWSLNYSYRAGKWTNLDMPKIVRERMGLAAIEYVNQFFENPTLYYLRKLKKNCDDNGITNVLIMCDYEDPTAGTDPKERHDAAIAHRKWIDAAHFLGCYAIRCNMRGGPKDWKKDPDLVKRGAESFHDMLAYAKSSGVKVVIENHGGSSSDPEVLLALMKEVNDPNFGMLLDLGNWNEGDDQYEAIRKLAPWAKGISVKEVPGYELAKKLRICMASGFHGYWGIESGIESPAGLSPDAIMDAEIAAALKVKAVLEEVVLKKS